jgi:hypothetical protein
MPRWGAGPVAWGALAAGPDITINIRESWPISPGRWVLMVFFVFIHSLYRFGRYPESTISGFSIVVDMYRFANT